jgi:hypothetical protein
LSLKTILDASGKVIYFKNIIKKQSAAKIGNGQNAKEII